MQSFVNILHVICRYVMDGVRSDAITEGNSDSSGELCVVVIRKRDYFALKFAAFNVFQYICSVM